MNLTNILEKRYSTKVFNGSKKIPDEQWKQIEDALKLSPSSTNSQPWHFIIASTDEGKRRLTKGTEGTFDFNTPKILDASHAVLFCAKTDIDEDYLNHLLELEEQAGRFVDKEFKTIVQNGRNRFVNMHKQTLNDLQHWMEKQVYLNLGNVLLGAAVLGIDALPMEGIDLAKMNEEFGLKEKGYTAVVLASFGYKSDDDFNDKLPKSRRPHDEIMTKI